MQCLFLIGLGELVVLVGVDVLSGLGAFSGVCIGEGLSALGVLSELNELIGRIEWSDCIEWIAWIGCG